MTPPGIQADLALLGGRAVAGVDDAGERRRAGAVVLTPVVGADLLHELLDDGLVAAAGLRGQGASPRARRRRR